MKIRQLRGRSESKEKKNVGARVAANTHTTQARASFVSVSPSAKRHRGFFFFSRCRVICRVFDVSRTRAWPKTRINSELGSDVVEIIEKTKSRKKNRENCLEMNNEKQRCGSFRNGDAAIYGSQENSSKAMEKSKKKISSPCPQKSTPCLLFNVSVLGASLFSCRHQRNAAHRGNAICPEATRYRRV